MSDQISVQSMQGVLHVSCYHSSVTLVCNHHAEALEVSVKLFHACHMLLYG